MLSLDIIGYVMNVEIRKINFINKGAKLMLDAICERLMSKTSDIRLVMAPSARNAPYRDRAMIGAYQKAWYWRFAVQWGDLGVLIPAAIRSMYGVVLDKEIDVVVDAAGFAYGDQWGSNSVKELARSSKRWKERGTKLILMPQAMGPFTSQSIRRCLEIVVRNASLVFARDRVSFRHIVDVVGHADNVLLAPDFTNLVAGYVPLGAEALYNRVCIVPNYQMISKKTSVEGERYSKLMVQCVRNLMARGESPFFLVHEGEKDIELSNKIIEELGSSLEILRYDDPRHIKGVLGGCKGVIGSRFHALVGSLSQSVPTLAVGWSHKYEMLFEDYRFAEGILDLDMSSREIDAKIDLLCVNDSNIRIRRQLDVGAEEQKREAEAMWQRVESLLEI